MPFLCLKIVLISVFKYTSNSLYLFLLKSQLVCVMEHIIGHRERARRKLLNSKPGVLPDYEILELLLFIAIPRQDTKKLAKDLINKFGSFAKVITADSEALLQMNGVGESILACFRLMKEGAIRLAKEEIQARPVISSWQSLISYLRTTIGHTKKENFIVLYLNNQNELIDQDINEQGTVDQINIYPREIAKRALFLNSSAVIIAHNHPSGSNKPSKADIEITKQIVNALSTFKITVHDHVIINDKDFFSFKSEGLLN